MGDWDLCDRGQGRRWRGLGKGMRGPSGRGLMANWRRQGPNFRPRSPSPSMRPRAANRAQIGTPKRSGGSRNRRPRRWKGGSIPCWGNGNILGKA